MFVLKKFFRFSSSMICCELLSSGLRLGCSRVVQREWIVAQGNIFWLSRGGNWQESNEHQIVVKTPPFFILLLQKLIFKVKTFEKPSHHCIVLSSRVTKMLILKFTICEFPLFPLTITRSLNGERILWETYKAIQRVSKDYFSELISRQYSSNYFKCRSELFYRSRCH